MADKAPAVSTAPDPVPTPAATVQIPTITLQDFCENQLTSGETRVLVQLFASNQSNAGFDNDTEANFALRYNQFSHQPVRS